MKILPSPTRKRLVVLAQLLSQKIALGTKRLTSAQLSILSGWSESTIRRDISLIGGAEGAKGGYIISILRDKISSALDIGNEKNPRKCCIVGLGRLGSILLDSTGFDKSAFLLVAGVDSSPNRTEILRSEIPLYPTSKLESVVKSQGIEFALLAVSESSAQKATDRLISCGIRGIVNYTNTILAVPEGFAVENVSPSFALANLASKL